MNHLIPLFSTNGQSIMSGYYTKKNLLVSIQTNNSNTKSLIIANGSVAYFRKKNVNIFRCRLISAYNFLTILSGYSGVDSVNIGDDHVGINKTKYFNVHTLFIL